MIPQGHSKDTLTMVGMFPDHRDFYIPYEKIKAIDPASFVLTMENAFMIKCSSINAYTKVFNVICEECWEVADSKI